MSAVIEVKELVKHYAKADKNAVDGISFDVEEGEFFTFLGPNGAGKTTTISILTTTLSKTSGEVTIAGFNIEHHAAEIRQNLGVIFQQPSLDLNLSAEENIRFHSVLYGLYAFRPTFSMMPKEYQERVYNLAEVLGIREEIFDPVKSFSGGMKRKLEIIRSLMHDPKVLFLDEPTTGLDPQSRKNLWDYLIEVRKKQHTTIFLTTHYLEESEDADRVCVINDGKIVMLGTPRHLKETLISNYLVVETDNLDSLRAELAAKDLSLEEGEELRIYLNDANVHQTIKSIQTPLSRLEVHTPTLEEAYIEIIREADHKEEHASV